MTTGVTCGRVVRVLWWVLACVLAGGCQLPDAGPFVAGTAQLKGAVAAGGAAVEQELRLTFDDAGRADELKKNWAARNATMAALLRYAQSLDAIVAAGNDGAASAARVADAVTGLAEAAGVAIPGSAEALAVATDTVKFLSSQIAKARAAGELAASLDAAQPAIEAIASLMRKDLEDLAVVQQAASGLEALDLVDEFNTVSAQRKGVLRAIGQIDDPTKPNARAEYAALNKVLAEIEPRYVAYKAREAAIENRRRAAMAVLEATGRALDEWAAAHAELASAARHKRAVSGASLTAAATEVRELVKRMREL